MDELSKLLPVPLLLVLLPELPLVDELPEVLLLPLLLLATLAAVDMVADEVSGRLTDDMPDVIGSSEADDICAVRTGKEPVDDDPDGPAAVRGLRAAAVAPIAEGEVPAAEPPPSTELPLAAGAAAALAGVPAVHELGRGCPCAPPCCACVTMPSALPKVATVLFSVPSACCASTNCCRN